MIRCILLSRILCGGDVYGELPVNESGGWTFYSEETKEIKNLDDLNLNAEIYSLCKHDYVIGKLMNHKKYSDNSCKVDYYNSKKCSKCGEVVLGELINTVSFGKCPH